MENPTAEAERKHHEKVTAIQDIANNFGDHSQVASFGATTALTYTPEDIENVAAAFAWMMQADPDSFDRRMAVIALSAFGAVPSQQNNDDSDYYLI